MALFTTTLIGMQVSRSALSAVLLRKQSGLPTLAGSALSRITPDMLQVNHREPNVRQPTTFVEQLKLLREKLQTRESRVALSLPDASGRVLLLEIDATWKNREEALEMIRWKLKKSVSLEPANLQIDFQSLAAINDDRCPVLVAAIARPILEQYEELLQEAGFQPAWIDFTGLSLVRAFSEYLVSSPMTGLVFWLDSTLGTIFFHSGRPVFYRTKLIPFDQADNVRIVMECTYSVLAYRQQFSGSSFDKVLYLAQNPADSALCNLLSGCFEQSLLQLDSKGLCAVSSVALPDNMPLESITGAIAAAAGRLICG